MTTLYDQNNNVLNDCVGFAALNNQSPVNLSTIQSKSSAYQITVDDAGTTLTNTATMTFTLPLATSVPNGFWFQFYSDVTTGAVTAATIAVSGSDKIDINDTSMMYAAGGISSIFVCDGVSQWFILACSARDTGAGNLIRSGDLGSGSRVYGAVNLVPSSSATFSPTIGYIYMQPFFFPRSTTISTLAIEVTTLGTSNTIRCGLYGPGTKFTTNSTNGSYPYTLLLDCGTVSSASTGVKTITCSATVQGLVYVAIASNTGTAAVLRGSTIIYNSIMPRLGTISSTTIYGGYNVYAAGAFATNIASLIDTSATQPAVILY